MNKEELLKKIKALADSGIGGEKENAQKLLKRLMQKYNIQENDIKEDYIKEFNIKIPKVYKACELASQVFYSIVGSEGRKEGKGLYKWKGTKQYFIKATTAEFLEFKAKLKFYIHFLEKELETFYAAFVHANHIFPTKNIKDTDIKHELTKEDIKILNLARNLEKHSYILQIEEN